MKKFIQFIKKITGYNIENKSFKNIMIFKIYCFLRFSFNWWSNLKYIIPLTQLQKLNSKNNIPVNQSKKIAIHLHLFYIDLSNEFITYLTNIPVEYDLYITHCQNLSQNTIDIFNKYLINIQFIKVKNYGRDIGSFIYFINAINLDNYSLVLKIHTKKETMLHPKYSFIQYVFFRSKIPITDNNIWRIELLKSLIGCSTIIKNNINYFYNDKDMGMLAPQSFYMSNADKQERIYFKQICKKLNLIPYIKFVAGTMFWIRADALKKLQHQYTMEDFFDQDLSKKLGCIEHGFERIFGTLVLSQGYKVKQI